jgi:protocatechuate 3,4-dioxygenase beta subunit
VRVFSVTTLTGRAVTARSTGNIFRSEFALPRPRNDAASAYRFKTVKPAAYPAGQGRMRSPHIHFEVQGKYDHLITQMYFPGEPLNTSDPLLLSVNHPDLLIAKPMPSLDIVACPTFNFDIVLMRG